MEISKYKNIELFGKKIAMPLIQNSATKDKILIISTVLFASEGFCSISMRDIAKEIGITQASLYNHYENKEALLKAVLNHAKELYIDYHNYLDEVLLSATSFTEAIELIFSEPIKMDNAFTINAFSLVLTEQISNQQAGDIYNEIFMQYSFDFYIRHFQTFIDKGWVEPFDIEYISLSILHTVFSSIQAQLHSISGRKIPFSSSDILNQLKQFILHYVVIK